MSYLGSPETMGRNVYAVVGCSGGIGLATTELLLERGVSVLGLTHVKNLTPDLSRLFSAYEHFNCITGFDFNSDLKNHFTLISEKKIRVSHIIVCTGSLNKELYLSLDSSMFSIEMFRNCIYPLEVVRAFAKTMLTDRKKNRSITLVSTISTKLGNPGRLTYVASKGALEASMRVLCNELGRFGIRVNIVSPGLINTKMLKNNTDETQIDEFKKRIALGRVGEAKEVARVLYFLSSDDASYVNGTIIEVDGGTF
jgi:3-oxoacyl-[acyl-carrier protein] reductase